MKRRFLSAVLLAGLILSFITSCVFYREYEVTYDYGGVRESVTLTLKEGELALNDTPVREGYTFGGWYTDKGFTETFDFSNPIASNVTLYAKWIEKAADTDGYKDIAITLGTIRSTVKFSVEKYDTTEIAGRVIKTNASTSTGSGVIYAEDEEYYYCLTNNHVVGKGSKAYADITVIDYGDFKHSAELLAQDANYDLAAVRFKKDNLLLDLECAEIETEEAAVGEVVVAIGSPSGQTNTITVGNVTAKGVVNVTQGSSELSCVTFAVIKHDAHMDNGSSGGPLFNSELKIIGINYAAASGTDGFVFGCAVPSEKIIEFLEKYDLALNFE